jgi:TolB protein
MPARHHSPYSHLPLLLALLGAPACNGAPPEPGPSGSGSPPPAITSSASAAASAPSSAGPAAAPPPVAMAIDERRGILGRISFISERDGNREVYVIGPDGAGEQRLTTNPAADYNGPASPDGASVLLIRAEDPDHEGPQQLFLRPIEGGSEKPLSPQAGRIRHPSFAPDGKWIVFETDAASPGGAKAGKTKAGGAKTGGSKALDAGSEEPGYSDIHRIGADGKGATRLTNNPEGNFEPAISPSGDAILLLSSRDRAAELYRIRPDGSEPTRLTQTPRDEWGARFSPGGDEIVFVSDRGGSDRIYLMPAAGGAARRLTRRETPARAVEDHPTWAPAGKKLAYEVSAPSIPTRVIINDLETGREIEVLAPEGGGQMTSPAWSPDGRYLALTVTNGADSRIYLVRADGTGLTPLTAPSGANWNPLWVPPKRKQGG